MRGAVRLASVLLAPLVLVGLGLVLGIAAERAFAAERVAGWLLWGGVALVAWVSGRAYVHLAHGPLFPRSNYYGSQPLPPEPTHVYRHHRVSIAASVTAAIGGSALAVLETAPGHRWMSASGAISVAAGILYGSRISLRLLDEQRAAALERSLWGKGILFLRRFRHSRAVTSWLSMLAAGERPLVLIASPEGLEALRPSWYLVALLNPARFFRMVVWRTSHQNWERVAASCMARAAGVVVDCTGLDLTPTGRQMGVAYELVTSALGFGSSTPTACLAPFGTRLPRLPAPLILNVRQSWWSLLWHGPAIVGRLRVILGARLAPAEARYLVEYYAHFTSDLEMARTADGLLAQRRATDAASPDSDAAGEGDDWDVGEGGA